MEMFVTLLVAVVGGFVGALSNHFFQNKTKVIVNKAWIESKQKLVIDNTIEIINETKELRIALDELSYLVVRTSGGMSIDQLNKLLPANEVMENAIKKFSKDAVIENKKIENFLFLLERDMRINGEISVVREEIGKIEKIKKDMNEYILKRNINKIKYSDITDIRMEIKSNFFTEDFEEKENKDVKEFKALEESINNILDIYVRRLNKKQKSWFGKLLNLFYKRGNE